MVENEIWIFNHSENFHLQRKILELKYFWPGDTGFKIHFRTSSSFFIVNFHACGFANYVRCRVVSHKTIEF